MLTVSSDTSASLLYSDMVRAGQTEVTISGQKCRRGLESENKCVFGFSLSGCVCQYCIVCVCLHLIVSKDNLFFKDTPGGLMEEKSHHQSTCECLSVLFSAHGNFLELLRLQDSVVNSKASSRGPLSES